MQVVYTEATHPHPGINNIGGEGTEIEKQQVGIENVQINRRNKIPDYNPVGITTRTALGTPEIRV
jgi:hypothetical protein